MKKIFRKNQIIITSLAALIAVAGYLNHIESNEKDLSAVSDNAEQETTLESQNNNGKDSSNEDGEGTPVSSNSGETGDIDSNDIDMSGEPGEAVFVNAVGTVDFIVEAKLLREQTRANSKAMLMEVVNNTNAAEAEKQAAVDKITELADISEREMAAENLISAKGYENVVVTITDNAADVMIVSDTLSDVERAQIEEIVKSKTQVSADKITITAVKTN
ncbi:MAG: SpoIIIAH-like family protein [Lachnospiraceae bacterium]